MRPATNVKYRTFRPRRPRALYLYRPPSFSLLWRSLKDERTAAALRSWRYGEEELAQQPAHLREDDETAIRNGVDHLQRFTTMDELTHDYYGGSYKTWVPAACGGAPEGDPLWHAIVREVAYWRRCQRLVTDQVAVALHGFDQVEVLAPANLVQYTLYSTMSPRSAGCDITPPTGRYR